MKTSFDNVLKHDYITTKLLVLMILDSVFLSQVSSLNLVDGKNVVEMRDPTRGGQPGFWVEISYQQS